MCRVRHGYAIAFVTFVFASMFSFSAYAEKIRVAQFNIRELTTAKLATRTPDGKFGAGVQLKKAAEIIRRVQPDILVINEIDFDEETRANARHFLERFLQNVEDERATLTYEHIFVAPVNTGLPTGHDLNNDDKTDGPEDAYGYGRYPGQYGMAIYSRFPIDTKSVRTFQKLLWKDMPGNHMPDGTNDKPDFYSKEEVALLRLSSKSYWDVPVKINGATIHLLVSHPTPPVFDGPEDANGRRNYDEIRLWADYISDKEKAAYIVDDAGKRGGLGSNESFIIIGDLNADPVIAEPVGGKRAIEQLLNHPRIQDPQPRSEGAATFVGRRAYDGDKALRTAAFGRADYVLPSRDLKVIDSGVVWPASENAANGSRDIAASDHHLVWVDLHIQPAEKSP